MNNRFKFRIWDNKSSRFIEEFTLHHSWIVFDINRFFNIFQFSQYSFQQYTGLNDKNGKEIYEGDIITGLQDYGPAGFIKVTVQIYWDSVDGYQWRYWDLKTIEVVGNVFENPELI